MSHNPPENQTIRFYDKHAKPWSDNHLDAGYWQPQLHIFHKLLPTGRVLEIGCGGGRDARELIKLGYDYVGTDISTGLLKEARKNVPGHHFLEQDMYKLSFLDKFDGFWASAVLLHAPKYRAGEALKSISNVLKPGAIGFISIKKGQGEGIFDGRFFSFWTEKEFKDILAQAAFKTLKYMNDTRSPTDDWLCFFVQRVRR